MTILLTKCHGEQSVSIGSRSVIRTDQERQAGLWVGDMGLGIGEKSSLWGWRSGVVGLDQAGLALEWLGLRHERLLGRCPEEHAKEVELAYLLDGKQFHLEWWLWHIDTGVLMSC